jgi:FAD/FMN-containing dehydrogenase
MESVKFARERGLEVAVRGGGHSAAGLGLCQGKISLSLILTLHLCLAEMASLLLGGLVIDLSMMRDIRIDPDARRVRVEAGCMTNKLLFFALSFSFVKRHLGRSRSCNSLLRSRSSKRNHLHYW